MLATLAYFWLVGSGVLTFNPWFVGVVVFIEWVGISNVAKYVFLNDIDNSDELTNWED